MKPSPTLVNSLQDITQVRTTGQLRQIASQMLLALARGELSAEAATAGAKTLSAISQNIDSEVKLAMASVTLRERGAHLGQVAKLGTTLIDQDVIATSAITDSRQR